MNTVRSIVAGLKRAVAGRRGESQQAAAPAPRDYAQERADDRRAGLSEEDRAWEAASQRRARENQERDQPPPAP